MKWFATKFVKLYRLCIRPLIGETCRFSPSCSEYSLEALEKYGFFKGAWLTIRRIVRCNPWHPGGHDPVP